MLIIGAKGFAKEVLEVLMQMDYDQMIYMYDDVNRDVEGNLFGKYPILKTTDEVLKCFNDNNMFTIGIGNPILRKKLFDKFSALGGALHSTISPKAIIGVNDIEIGQGTNLMSGSVITASIKIGVGCLINLNCTIGHDCNIGNFVEMSPGVHISGNSNIGDYSVIGTNATILPKISLGRNVVVGAGAVVTKDVPDNSLVIGMPAKVVKELNPIDF